MDEWWSETDSRAKAAKYSQSATFHLIAHLRTLSEEERKMSDLVVADWALSTDDCRRFDALSAIDELGILSAAPQLHVLESRILERKDPGAPFELEKLRRILANLEQ
jgi:hypothetical protein